MDVLHSSRSLSGGSAAALSILYTIIYVLPFYLSSTTRPSPRLSRDAPAVIRARIRAVTLSCMFSTLATLTLLVTRGGVSIPQAVRILGYWPWSLVDIGKSLLLTAILFAGPLFEAGIIEGRWQDWIQGRGVLEVLNSWGGWRNYVAGPITEEVVFRAAIVPLHLLVPGITPGQIVFRTPLYFGIAHVHHFYEFTLTHPHLSIIPGLIRSLVQFGYTSIFGFFATFLFLRTGSLPAAILVHSFCNWSGLPRFWGRVEPGEPLGPPVTTSIASQHRADDDQEETDRMQVGTHDHHNTLIWTLAYYIILVAGAAAFWKLLGPLTESENALIPF
ncbi:MAG: hypothetical protein M1823_005758 [Watsoniomyces obsoletus]|nr:MAG: hypothetical protein M1823_005758 [Watsoniomyces obsoletus]